MKNKIDYLWLVLKYGFLAMLIAVILRGFFLIPVPVEGNSMENTLNQGDMIVMEKISKINRFDVVVFQLASGTTYIKRVIGLPGDAIEYRDDQLYINDQPMEESFLTKNQKSDHQANAYTNDFTLTELTGTTKLAENSYFVLGDNRRVSKDSRSFGAIAGENILGKARFVYYPFDHIHLIGE